MAAPSTFSYCSADGNVFLVGEIINYPSFRLESLHVVRHSLTESWTKTDSLPRVRFIPV